MDGLEDVRGCPVCRSRKRELMHGGLRDQVFFAAQGEWALWRCGECGCGFLDPRPDAASISRAYEAYYTHVSEERTRDCSGRLHRGLHWVKSGLDHCYLNLRYGYRLRPSIPGGFFLRGVVPDDVRKLEHRIRHLPPPHVAGERILDVGCGNGAFLAIAENLGYGAVGVEFDAEAAEVSRHGGFEVLERRVPGSRLSAESFTHITLNHVIEHLHDPVAALVEFHGLLKPGGRIWIKTPNIDAAGHSRYGAAWRGLEPPRHLVLFGPNALVRTLRSVGFEEPKIVVPEPEAWFYLRSSAAIARGQDPYGTHKLPAGLAREAREFDRRALHCPERGESITVVAWKGRRER